MDLNYDGVIKEMVNAGRRDSLGGSRHWSCPQELYFTLAPSGGLLSALPGCPNED